MPPARFRDQTLKAGIVELAVDGLVAIAATELADFHGDPADRIIAATAIEAAARLVTADAALLEVGGRLKTHDARS